MKKSASSLHSYPLQWFDLMCNETLNPERNNLKEFSPEEVSALLNNFNKEFTALQDHIKTHLFTLSSPKKIRAALVQYYTAVLLLNQQASSNINHYPARSNSLKAVGSALVNLTEELSQFLEKRYAPFIPDGLLRQNRENNTMVAKPDPFKVTCDLSGDQIGLILKAADDVKIVRARSLSAVFRAIVPFLSTFKAKHLSWDTMRSHTYTVEEVDKEIVIRKLEMMINKIKSY